MSQDIPLTLLSPGNLEPLSAEQEATYSIISVDREVLKDHDLDNIPDGYGIIGGAARAILLRQLFNQDAFVRDVDLTGITEFGPDRSLASYLSNSYMPDDAAFGHGVRIVQLDDYMSSRDFTMNEAIVINGRIIVTADALRDLETKTIRPTRFEAEQYPDIGIGPKLAMKALLMQAVFEEQYGSATCEGFEIPSQLSEFYVALALNKAFQYGEDVTQRFIEILSDHGYVNYDVDDDPIGVALDMAKEMAHNFIFRGSDVADSIMTERGFYDDESPGAPDDEYDHAVRLWERSKFRIVGGQAVSDWADNV